MCIVGLYDFLCSQIKDFNFPIVRAACQAISKLMESHRMDDPVVLAVVLLHNFLVLDVPYQDIFVVA